MLGNKIQNYKILSLLGEGGMGSVYKAFDVKLERYVALKILNLNSAFYSGMLERFRKEARNQAKLSHPNIVPVYGFVEEKDVVGIAMEFVEGKTIEQILFDEGKLSLNHSLDIISQVLDGISYAHSQGFIHRDLKPSNIIIDLNGNAKIMDFGISKSVDEIETFTQHSARPGTLMYMSPEQLSGDVVTIRSDIYSLGVTLFEMLVGVHPYDAKTFYDIVEAHINKIPPRISDQFPSVPAELDEIILKSMGKSNEFNFNSALEFKEAINNLQTKINTLGNNDFTKPDHKASYKIKRQKKSLFGSKLFNFFLFVVFVILIFIVYSVVENTIKLKANEEKINKLNYSQDYSDNPEFTPQSNWKLSSIDLDKNLNAIYFLDYLNGIIVGSEGTILKTTDGGKDWVHSITSFNSSLHAITEINNNIYCCGDNGIILKYDFETKNWGKVESNTNESLFDIKFINDNVGFIVGSNGIILKTEDGGLTWFKIKNNVNSNLFNIDFADNQTGFAVGWGGAILKTINQGSDWQKIRIGFNNYLKNVLFINQFIGFIVGGDGLVLRTEDGGSHWKKIDTETSSGLYKIYFENNVDGIILSNRGEVLKTIDAGKTWVKESVGKPVVLNDVKKLKAGKYILVGNSGSVFTSVTRSD